MARQWPAPEAMAPVAAALALLGTLGVVWAGRLPYRFDLEWMEGGMLAHAWRLQHGLQLYVAPNPDFVPYVYPPGYAALVAVLGLPFGLSLPLGRAVSLVATLGAAGALAYGAREDHRGRPWLLLPCAAVFLGTFPQAGAFYDLVRPDALALALTGWSIVLGREERRGSPVLAGLLLAAAFLVKHNFALLGAPMALGLALRGWRPAAAFVASSAGPALVAVLALQWWSAGGFLTWLLEVPAHHPMLWRRAWLDVPREWGTALPAAWACVGIASIVAVIRQDRLPVALAAGLPAWSGALAAWWMTRDPWEDPALRPLGAGLAYWAAVAVPVAGALWAVGAVAGGRAARPSWRAVYDSGVLVGALGMALAMRVHDSGYVNVHAPLFWCLALWLARATGRWAASPAPIGRIGAGVALTAQLLWSVAQIDGKTLVPTAEDAAAGEAFVDAMRAVDGPILSPFSAWTPTYAGRPPSLHAMGVWDCNYADGPYQEDLDAIADALRHHRWTLFLAGPSRLLGDSDRYYEEWKVVVPPGSPIFEPRSGYLARPTRVLVPKDEWVP